MSTYIINKMFLRFAVVAIIACLLVQSCSDAEEKTDDGYTKGIPITFKAGANKISNEQPGTRAEIDDQDPAINDPDDLVGSNVYLFAANYLRTPGSYPVWNDPNLLMNGWVGQVTKENNQFNVIYANESLGQDLLYYDPTNKYYYDFRAVYPTTPANGVTLVKATSTAPPSLKLELYKRPDLMVAKINGREKSNKPQNLKFEHKLVQVSFQIQKNPGLEQNVYLNKMALSGRTRANFDPVNDVFSDIDGITGASLLLPGYPHPDFIIPADTMATAPKKIRDVFLFEVPALSAAEIIEDQKKNAEKRLQYRFEIVLNEVSYYLTLPPENKAWEAGKRYLYTLNVTGSDIYIEIKDVIEREIWTDEDHEIDLD